MIATVALLGANFASDCMRAGTARHLGIPRDWKAPCRALIWLKPKARIYGIDGDSSIPAISAIRTNSERLPAPIFVITLAR